MKIYLKLSGKGGWIFFRLKNYQVSIMLWCFTPESLEFFLWIFICYKLYFLLQAGSHLTNAETSGELPHRSSFQTSGFLQQGWSRFLNLRQWPLKYPFKASASWYFSIASGLSSQIGFKKITRKMKKKSVKLDHFPMDRG